MADYDDPKTDAYHDRKLAEQIKWQANQAERKGYTTESLKNFGMPITP